VTPYLVANPPRRSQYRTPRRARLTGAIALHTAENVMDTVGPDTGAENVARFIVNRTDPGSYHEIADSDSRIQLVDYDHEAYHDGTGGNRYSLGQSFACRTSDWRKMSAARRSAFIENGAIGSALMAAHVHKRTGIVVPAARITAAQYRAGAAGFVTHGELDPPRRSDPGADFPWAEFLPRFTHHRDRLLGFTRPPAPPTPEDDDMTPEQAQMLREIHEQLTVSRDDKAKAGPTVRWMVAKANDRIVRLLGRG
jgi:hypothetical protein